MAIMDKDCLYSSVKNTSGKTMRFGFLPPHGAQLAANEEYTVFGNILEAIGGSDRALARRAHQAFAAAIDRGDLLIVKTPAPILKDAVTNATKMLKLSNTSLSAAAPCWDASEGYSDGAWKNIGWDDRQVPA